jgi:hypothetical protein
MWKLLRRIKYLALVLLKDETSFHQQIGLKFTEETNEVLHLECGFCVVLKLGHFGN